MARKKKDDHTGFRNNKLFCFHCGQSHAYTLPIPITELAKICKAFNALHKDCKPVWKQPEPDMSTSVTDRINWWAEHGEHGMSSKTIWSVLATGGKYPGLKFDYEIIKDVILPKSEHMAPSDPDDFRRCYLLLKAIPEFRPRLDELRSISPVWNSLVDNWDELTRLSEDQIATNATNGMYEMMKNFGC